MEKHSYERLSAQDNTFLLMETASAHMQAGSTNIVEAGPLQTCEGGININLFKRAMESVLHLVPRYRQRLMWPPIGNRPVWVDDPHFNLDYHIRHTALPHPGSAEDLKRLSARVMAQQLDRARPLWEMWVVEGLQGDRFGLIFKNHHCMFDGISGTDASQLLFSPQPEYEIHDAPRFVPHTPPSGLELLRDALLRRARLPLQILRGVGAFRPHTKRGLRELRVRTRAVAEFLATAMQTAPQSPLNGPLSPHRRQDWLSMPFAHFKAVSGAFGCAVNDLVLATVAGAVREFLISRRVNPEEIEFRVSVPVSVRGKDEHQLGNRVSSWILSLPIGEANPRTRLEVLQQATKQLKASRQALAFDMMMALAEWMPTAFLSLGMRGAGARTNMIVSNVPGPRDPLYLLGAKILECYPAVPLLENTGLGVTSVSYAGKMCWGFNADYELVPDLRKFVGMIDASFRGLAHAAGVNLGGQAAAGAQRGHRSSHSKVGRRPIERTQRRAPATGPPAGHESHAMVN